MMGDVDPSSVGRHLRSVLSEDSRHHRFDELQGRMGESSRRRSRHAVGRGSNSRLAADGWSGRDGSRLV